MEPIVRRQARTDIDLAQDLTLVMGITRTERGRVLGQRIVDCFGAGPSLARLSIDDLCMVPGIGRIRAHRISAAFRLGRWAQQYGCSMDEVGDLARIRAQVPINETVLLAYRPQDTTPPITLDMGIGFNAQTPVGGYLAQLLSEVRSPWWILLLRPGDTPTPEEIAIGQKMHRAARILGIELSRILIFGKRGVFDVPSIQQPSACVGLAE